MSGDEPEFGEFVRVNTSALVRAAYLLTGRVAAAEDLVHDTLLRLYGKWSQVQAADVPLAYVRRSMVNGFLNSRRSRSGTELLFADPPDHRVEPDPAGAVGNRHLVAQLLASLGPKQRAIVVMRYLDDLSDAEIARIVGCRPGTVRSTVSRSLAQLRTIATQLDNPVMEQR